MRGRTAAGSGWLVIRRSHKYDKNEAGAPCVGGGGCRGDETGSTSWTNDNTIFVLEMKNHGV